MCELLVWLPDVIVSGGDDTGVQLVVHVESRVGRLWCRRCGVRAVVKDRPLVVLVDLPRFGRPTRLAWRNHRVRCPEVLCPTGSWTLQDERIAAPRVAMTVRAARWAMVQVGCRGRAVPDVAGELGCDWHTVNDAVVAYGEALPDADGERAGVVSALGLDETLFVRTGRFRTQSCCTSITDITPGRVGRLIEFIEGCTASEVSGWIDAQPAGWRAGIDWGVLDMSGPDRKVYNDSLPDAAQVADLFHVHKHANSEVDEAGITDASSPTYQTSRSRA